MTTEGDGSLLTEEFAKFAKETLKEWKVPGVSIAVIDGEHVFTQVCLPDSSIPQTFTSKPQLLLTGITELWCRNLPRHSRHLANPLVRRINHQGLCLRRHRSPHRYQDIPGA